MNFLDQEIIEKFRETVNSEVEFFSQDSEWMDKYNLFCAVMDRLDSAVGYLNNFEEYPASETDFIIFIVYSSMIVDAIKILCEKLGETYGFSETDSVDSYIYFKEVCQRKPLKLSEEDCPTDDKFFEYLRALSMAHPFGTSRPKFLKQNEIQYSPWVIASEFNRNGYGINDVVGVRVYSNHNVKIIDIVFSFELLKKYVESRLNVIKKITKKLEFEIEKIREEWRKECIPDAINDTEKLICIQNSLKKRHTTIYEIDELIRVLTIKISNRKNEQIVWEFRREIYKIIPDIVEAYKKLDYNHIVTLANEFLRARPKDPYKGFGYQLQKIYCDLLNSDDYVKARFARIMAKSFSEEFAKKWVLIDIENMSSEEIIVLVQIACFFEEKEAI